MNVNPYFILAFLILIFLALSFFSINQRNFELLIFSWGFCAYFIGNIIMLKAIIVKEEKTI